MPRQGDVTDHLDELISALRVLSPEEAGEIAGVFLAATIVPDTIEDWIEKVERAKVNATQNPSTKLANRGAAKGTRGRAGYDIFLAQLLSAAESLGFCWTIWWNDVRSREEGSLIKAFDALAPHLPPDFFPKGGDLRRTVAKMRTRLQSK